MAQPPLLSRYHRLARTLLLAIAVAVSGCVVDIPDPPPRSIGSGSIVGSVLLTDVGPVADFTVKVEGRYQSSPCLLCYGYTTREVGRAVSDAAGNFRLDDIEVGTYWIDVDRPTGYRVRSLGHFYVREDLTTKFDVVFDPVPVD